MTPKDRCQHFVSSRLGSRLVRIARQLAFPFWGYYSFAEIMPSAPRRLALLHSGFFQTSPTDLPLPSASGYPCRMRQDRYHRGLPPHYIAPMLGAHITIHRTSGKLRLPASGDFQR